MDQVGHQGTQSATLLSRRSLPYLFRFWYGDDFACVVFEDKAGGEGSASEAYG